MLPIRLCVPLIAVLAIAGFYPASAVPVRPDKLALQPDKPKQPEPKDDKKKKGPWIEMTYLQASGSVNLKTGKVHRHMSIQGRVHMPPGSDVVGVMYQMKMLNVVDESGKDLASELAGKNGAFNQRYYSSVNNGFNRNSSIYVSASLQNLPRVPTKFKKIKGQASILMAKKRINHKIKPVRPGGLIDLANGLTIQITNVKTTSSTVEVEFSYEAPHANIFFNVNQKPPFITAMDLYDEKNSRLYRRGWSTGSAKTKNGLTKGTAKITYRLTGKQKPGHMQIQAVTQTEEKAVVFELKDIPVPIYHQPKAAKPKGNQKAKPDADAIEEAAPPAAEGDAEG